MSVLKNPSLHMIHLLPSPRAKAFLKIFEVFLGFFLDFGIIDVVLCWFLKVQHPIFFL